MVGGDRWDCPHGLCMLVPVLDALYSVSYFGRMDSMNERMIYVIAPTYFLVGCGAVVATLVAMWLNDRRHHPDGDN